MITQRLECLEAPKVPCIDVGDAGGSGLAQRVKARFGRICDRSVHGAHRINLEGDSVRKLYAERANRDPAEPLG